MSEIDIKLTSGTNTGTYTAEILDPSGVEPMDTIDYTDAWRVRTHIELFGPLWDLLALAGGTFHLNLVGAAPAPAQVNVPLVPGVHVYEQSFLIPGSTVPSGVYNLTATMTMTDGPAPGSPVPIAAFVNLEEVYIYP